MVADRGKQAEEDERFCADGVSTAPQGGCKAGWTCLLPNARYSPDTLLVLHAPLDLPATQTALCSSHGWCAHTHPP